MKFISKALTVAFTTIAAVGTLAGAIMFGLAGTPTAKILDEQTQETKFAGYGLLNYDEKNFFNLKYDEFLKYSRDNKKSLEDEIKKNEDAIKIASDKLPALEAIVKDAEQKLAEAISTNDQTAIAAAQVVLNDAKLRLDINIKDIEISTNNLNIQKALINAPIAYDVTIAGIIIMSFGIVFAALSAAMAINIEKSEDKKKAKKNKPENI